jgi:hypothetical protein
VKKAIDSHNEWKDRKSNTLGKSLEDLVQLFCSQPSSSFNIGEKLFQLDKATEFELNYSNYYPQIVSETAEKLSSFIEEEKERIEKRLKNFEEHKKRSQHLQKCLSINVQQEISQLKKSKSSMTRKRNELRLLRVQSQIKEEEEDEDDDNDKEDLSKKLENLQREYVSMTKEYEKNLSRVVELGCEYFPEIFSKYGIKTSPFIDSEIQIDNFQNYRKLPFGSNYPLFYGELGNEKFILKQYTLANEQKRKLFDREVRILRSLNHPRVISLKYVIYDRNMAGVAFILSFQLCKLDQRKETK